jgi:hypothetical protein
MRAIVCAPLVALLPVSLHSLARRFARTVDQLRFFFGVAVGTACAFLR